jgi:hypothetical protein
MMTGRIGNHNYRIDLETIKRKMEKREVKPITKTEKGDTEAKKNKDGKYI